MNAFVTRLAAFFRAERHVFPFSSLSLRAVLIAGFGIVFGLFVFVGALAIMGARTSISDYNKVFAVDIKTADLSQSSVIAMMKARRYEKDFLLSYREFGFDEAKSRYVTLLQANLADARKSLAELNRLVGNPEIADRIRRATQAIDSYENSFLAVVALYGQMGFIDTGLEGQFRGTARQIEVLLTPAERALVIDYLSIRRREKDFLLRAPEVNNQPTMAALAQFKKDVAVATMSAERKAQLTKLADTYQAQFGKYAELDDQVEEGTRHYRRAVQTIEPQLEKLLISAQAESDIARDAIQRGARQTETEVEAVGLIALILGILVAWMVARRITRSISQTMTFAERIAAGDLSTRTTHTGHDEFSVLGRSLNHMADALQKAIELQALRAKELQSMNETLQLEIAYRKQADDDLQKANTELERRILARTAELAKSEERFRRLAELSSDWYWEQDENFRFTKVSNSIGKLSGASGDVWLGKTRWELPIDMTPEEWTYHKAVLNAHQKFTDFEYKVNFETTGPQWLSIAGEPLFDPDGRFIGYRGVGKNITERKRIEEHIRHLSLHDTLTGLPNRSLLLDRLAQAMTYATRHLHMVWVLFIDLDGFKKVNDTLGHKAGDVVLNVTAKRLQSAVRDSDTVARLGGDEFVLILPERLEGSEIDGAVARIMEKVAEPIMIEGQEVMIACCIGVAAYPLDGKEAEILIEHADVAMYRAKQNGRNDVQFYNLSMRKELRPNDDSDCS